LEGEQERRREIEGKTRIGTIGSKVEQYRGITAIATVATASSLAKETEGPSIVGTDRVCSDERSREDKYKDGMPKSAGRVYTLKLIYAMDVDRGRNYYSCRGFGHLAQNYRR